MRRGLAVAALLSLWTSRALAQPVMPPYEAPPPEAQAAPPVPPPIVVPPPPAYPAQPYYGQPYYYQAAPPPLPQVREIEEPRWGLMIAGLAVFGASWTINAASAYVADEWKLAVPIVGPFMETQNIDTSPGHEYNRPIVALLVFDGLIETAGAVMLVAGALTHHRVKVYDRGPRVSLVPTAGASGGGIAAFGRF